MREHEKEIYINIVCHLNYIVKEIYINIVLCHLNCIILLSSSEWLKFDS
jgi:hypothetical protein